MGSYVGTGSNYVDLQIPFSPKIVYVYSNYYEKRLYGSSAIGCLIDANDRKTMMTYEELNNFPTINLTLQNYRYGNNSDSYYLGGVYMPDANIITSRGSYMPRGSSSSVSVDYYAVRQLLYDEGTKICRIQISEIQSTSAKTSSLKQEEFSYQTESIITNNSSGLTYNYIAFG